MNGNRRRKAAAPWRLFVSVLLALAVFWPLDAAAQATKYDFEVKNAEGKAIAGATVTATNAAGKQSAASTAANGMASIALPAGSHKFEVVAAGYTPSTFSANDNDTIKINSKTVVLARAAAATPAPAPAKPAAPATPPAQMTQAQRKAMCEQKRLTCMADWATTNSVGARVTPPDKTKTCWDNFYACEKGS